MATFVDPVSAYFGMTNKVVKLWEMALSEETRGRMGVWWKETWKLKGDEPPSDQNTSFIIELGKGETKTQMHPSKMLNYKGSFDLMYEKRNPNLLFIPQRSLNASVPMKILGLHATYSCSHPNPTSHELKLQYEQFEHWILHLRLPLPQAKIPSLTKRPTYGIGVTSVWGSFSLPCEINLKKNLEANITSLRISDWSIGLEHNVPGFSFTFKVSGSDNVEIKAIASCYVKTPQLSQLSASAEWKKDELKCSFRQNAKGLSLTSTCELNFEDLGSSVCSVGVRKKLDDHRGIQVARKVTLNVSAQVSIHNIDGSKLRVSFSNR